MKRSWIWDEATGRILELETTPRGDVTVEEINGVVAHVVSDSAADHPGDGDGPIMAAARDLLYAAEAFLGAFGGDVPDWLQREADNLGAAIKKARA